jgi:nucleotide-binding universal stress UspA family protein
MVQHLIVPIDGSEDALRAVDVACALARRCDARIDIVQVVPTPDVVGSAERDLAAAAARVGATDVEVTTMTEACDGTVADGIVGLLDRSPEATIVLSSHGRGRTAAVLGSVTDDLLRREFGPLVVVGGSVDTTDIDLTGPIVVPVDGSERSEMALPIAAAWAIELGVVPWIVEVADPNVVMGPDLVETTYPARLARRLRTSSGHQTEYEVLHGHDVAAAVASWAEGRNASFVLATTHGRSGLHRLTLGSTAAGIVRHAPCPVVLTRPPNLAGGPARRDDAVASR